MEHRKAAMQLEEAVQKASFAEFYRREYRSVAGLAYVLTGDHGAAEDLAQDAFLAAQRAWPKIATYDMPGSWVRRVLVNRSRSRFRNLSRERGALVRLRSVNDGAPPPRLDAETVDIWREVRDLPKRQAQVIALTYLDGLTLDEIGGILECSPLTAKTHLQRGKRTLARKLRTEEGFRS